MNSTRPLRILLGYSHYPYHFNVGDWVEAWLGRLRAQGLQVDGFCLTLKPPGPWLEWRDLDARWRRGDPELLGFYETLARRLKNYDVLVNWNGINLHPEFVRQLPTFNVFACFDDPESSENLSRPVAAAYDLAMVGNAAEVETYRGWGVQEARFWPMGFHTEDYDPSLTREAILRDEREVDVSLLCERATPWRAARLDKFAAAFPQGVFRGRGWPLGFLPEEQRLPLYRRTKIGVNFHNSTGPINFRTYILPANGVMQLCDNKAHLGQIYELNKEVVGFDTVEEAIELCRYYLAHEEERREIAAAGWVRAQRDYHELAVGQRLVDSVLQLWPAVPKCLPDVLDYLANHRRHTAAPRGWHQLKNRLRPSWHRIRSLRRPRPQ
jgi:spore maturation protein CgeB